jgi:hypothetical protein
MSLIDDDTIRLGQPLVFRTVQAASQQLVDRRYNDMNGPLNLVRLVACPEPADAQRTLRAQRAPDETPRLDRLLTKLVTLGYPQDQTAYLSLPDRLDQGLNRDPRLSGTSRE